MKRKRKNQNLNAIHTTLINCLYPTQPSRQRGDLPWPISTFLPAFFNPNINLPPHPSPNINTHLHHTCSSLEGACVKLKRILLDLFVTISVPKASNSNDEAVVVLRTFVGAGEGLLFLVLLRTLGIFPFTFWHEQWTVHLTHVFDHGQKGDIFYLLKFRA